MRIRLAYVPAVLALLLATAAPSRATEFCEVVKTRDGFVALRGTPEAGGKMIARMKAGDEVQLAGERKGGWEKVTFWPAGDRIEKGEAARKLSGWVNRRLIDICG